MNRIHVIGISPGYPLADEAKESLKRAKTVFASRRLHDLLREQEPSLLKGAKVRVINKVDTTLSSLKNTRTEAAVLASGDPLFFGIGKRITEELGGRKVIIYPALSSLQLAFAQAGLSWHDAFLVSLHGGQKRQWAPADLPLLCERHEKLAILTGGSNTPASIAPHMPKGARVWVAERLGYDDERIRKTTPARLPRMNIMEPNLLILESPEAKGQLPTVFGLGENEFKRTAELITKDEVRAVVLHKLRLPIKGVLWDVGAGSGSVSIEARRLSPGLEVYAIEQDRERVKNISDNALALKAGEMNVITGSAPSALKALPAPDRVFIGGSGASLESVISESLRRIKRGGIMVVTAITLESMESAQKAFKKAGLRADVTQVSVSRLRKVGKASYLRPLNPVFIIKVTA